MARRKKLQTTFIAGELATELSYRVDTKQYENGAKSLLNRRCLIAGGTSRRPGTKYLNGLFGGGPRLTEFVFNEDEQFILAWTSPGIMIAYTPDGGPAGNVTGGPWSGGIVNDMDWMQSANTVIVTHTSFQPQVITRIGPASWSLAPYEFFRSGPRTDQPYFKIAPPTLKLLPSATTGNITLQFTNGGWWVPGHVGQIVRYLGREIRITGVSDAVNATGDVLEKLPDTQSLTVANSSGFTEGESVLGSESNAKGVVAAIFPGRVDVYLRVAGTGASGGSTGINAGTTAALGVFAFQGSSLLGGAGGTGIAQPSLQIFQAGETLIGPAATTSITAAAIQTPAAVSDWDEQVFGPLYGYPSCVALHRNRLCFAGVPAVPNLLMASRLGNIFSFNVGDGSDGDAIVSTIGDAASANIRQLFSSDQLLLGTDKGLYYCPESANAPFTPSRISFIAFGSPWPIDARCKMRAFDDGVIATSQSVVIKARGTGDTQKTWNAQEVSFLSPHLLNTPYDMSVTTNFEGGPERYCVFSNSDGTLAVMMLVEAQDIRNFTPWNTAGFFGSSCVVKKRLYIAVLRDPTPGASFSLELFDNTLTLDGSKPIGSAAELVNIPFMFPSNQVVNVVTTSGFSLGVYPLHLDEIPPGPYWCGVNYATRIETLPPSVDDARGSGVGEYMRIVQALVFTQASARFAANGYELQAYQVTDDANLPPPAKKGPQRFKFLGWQREPTILITQPDPLPLTVLALKTEVAW